MEVKVLSLVKAAGAVARALAGQGGYMELSAAGDPDVHDHPQHH